MKTPSHAIVNIMPRTAACARSMFVGCLLSTQSPAFAADVGKPAVSGDAVPLTDQAARYREQAQPPRGQLALTVGVPVFHDEFLHGELTVDGRYGYKFWWLVPYVSGGFRQTRLDPLGWAWEARMRKLLAWHVTLGTRLEFPASQKLLPFVGIAGELDDWAYTEDSTSYCHESDYPDAWRCYKAKDWKAGRALKPQVGLLYEPEPSLALEFWVEYIHVVAPAMFKRSVDIVHPALGIAWHH